MIALRTPGIYGCKTSSQITGMCFKKGSDGVVDALLVSFNCQQTQCRVI